MESKTAALTLATLIAALLTLSGCELVEGIFKAGMWVGVLMVAIVAGILFAVMGRARRT